jgi:hypothetical protein
MYANDMNITAPCPSFVNESEGAYNSPITAAATYMTDKTIVMTKVAILIELSRPDLIMKPILNNIAITIVTAATVLSVAKILID